MRARGAKTINNNAGVNSSPLTADSHRSSMGAITQLKHSRPSKRSNYFRRLFRMLPFSSGPASDMRTTDYACVAVSIALLIISSVLCDTWSVSCRRRSHYLTRASSIEDLSTQVSVPVSMPRRSSQNSGRRSQDGGRRASRDAGSDTSYIFKVCQIIYYTECICLQRTPLTNVSRVKRYPSRNSGRHSWTIVTENPVNYTGLP